MGPDDDLEVLIESFRLARIRAGEAGEAYRVAETEKRNADSECRRIETEIHDLINRRTSTEPS